MTIDSERLEIVVLARLSTGARPPAVSLLIKATSRYRPATLSDAPWHQAIEDALHRLARYGVIDLERRIVRKAELADRVGAYTATRWEHWTDRLLPAAALGIRLDDRKALARLGVANGWAAAIAARELALWNAGPPPTPKGLGDALVWRDLGIAGAPEECPPKLRAHFLRSHLAIEGAKPDGLVRQIAARAVQAPNPQPDALRDAIVRSWLATADRPSLIDAARDAARDAQDGVFGERKVFIASVWDSLRRRPPWATLSLDDFKAQLVAAHRDQQLVLARADLVSAMDPAQVTASEIHTDNATFHFILREPHP